MIVKLETYLTHGFIGIFVDSAENGLNDWTRNHVDQGFSWRRDSVSFRTGNDGGSLEIEVELTANATLRENAKRIIQVPFEVENEQIVVADVMNFQEITIPVGHYALIFQHGWSEEPNEADDVEMWCVFTFMRDENAQPKILRADEQIIVPKVFTMTAEIA